MWTDNHIIREFIDNIDLLIDDADEADEADKVDNKVDK